MPEDSKYLVNLLVVVPARKEKEFMDNYVQEDAKNETQVVPESAKYLDLEDDDKNRIFRVVLFSKFPDSQKPRAIAGFPSKVFVYNEEKYKQDQETIKKLLEEK